MQSPNFWGIKRLTITVGLYFIAFENRDILCYKLFVLPRHIRQHVKYHYFNPLEQKDLIRKDNRGHVGIYLWYNHTTGKYYVGQSQDLGNKKSGRLFRYLRPSYLNARIGNSLIQNAFLKYGIASFSLIILDWCDPQDLTRREQYWIDLFKPEYNILTAAKSSAGYKHTPDSIGKMSGRRPDYKPNPDRVEKFGNWSRGRTVSQETQDKISARFGHGIFVYDQNFKFLGYYPSINKAKAAYNVELHTVTIQRRIKKLGVNNINILNMIWSYTPLPYSN